MEWPCNSKTSNNWQTLSTYAAFWIKLGPIIGCNKSLWLSNWSGQFPKCKFPQTDCPTWHETYELRPFFVWLSSEHVCVFLKRWCFQHGLFGFSIISLYQNKTWRQSWTNPLSLGLIGIKPLNSYCVNGLCFKFNVACVHRGHFSTSNYSTLVS